jgi:o-succinylbenzoate synthase
MSKSSSLLASYKKYALRFKKPAGTSRGYLYRQDNYFIRLARRDNPTCFGLGECGPLAGLSLDDRPDLERRLARICDDINRGRSPDDFDLADFPALAFGLEMARLDLQNGGQRILFETPFSRGEVSLPIHGLIWMAGREGLLKQVHQKVEAGFRCLKLKVGALDFEAECAVLNFIREAYPPDQIEIRLDANGAFKPDEALDKLNRLAQYQLHSIEQPVKPGQWPTLTGLCAKSPIPIALDEELIGLQTAADRQMLLETVKPRYLVLKPTLIGGFAAAECWIKEAEALGMGWWVNSALESNVGLNAIAQWTASLKPTMVQGLGTGGLYTNNIPSPIRLGGAALIHEAGKTWDLSAVADNV